MQTKILSFAILAGLLLQPSCVEWRPAFKASYFYSDPKQLELCQAIKENDAVGIKMALTTGADINAKGRDDMIPLCWAVYQQKKEMFRLLLEQGANPNTRMTLERGTTGTVLEYLILFGWTDYVDVLLRYGKDVNLNLPAKNDFDRTPLFSAVKYERAEIIKMLIEHGADLEWKDDVGWTPFLVAVVMNNFKMALLLLEYGADYHVVSDRGDDVVFLLETSSAGPSATQYEWKLKLARTLASKGLDINMNKVRQGHVGPRWEAPMTSEQLQKGKVRRTRSIDL